MINDRSFRQEFSPGSFRSGNHQVVTSWPLTSSESLLPYASIRAEPPTQLPQFSTKVVPRSKKKIYIYIITGNKNFRTLRLHNTSWEAPGSHFLSTSLFTTKESPRETTRSRASASIFEKSRKGKGEREGRKFRSRPRNSPSSFRYGCETSQSYSLSHPRIFTTSNRLLQFSGKACVRTSFARKRFGSWLMRLKKFFFFFFFVKEFREN